MNLTLFLRGSFALNARYFFITGFLICHSFLDFLYIEYFAAIGETNTPANNSLFQIAQ